MKKLNKLKKFSISGDALDLRYSPSLTHQRMKEILSEEELSSGNDLEKAKKYLDKLRKMKTKDEEKKLKKEKDEKKKIFKKIIKYINKEDEEKDLEKIKKKIIKNSK